MCFSFVMCFIIGFTNMAFATDKDNQEPDQHYSGKIIFKPSVETSYTYDTNYYLDAFQEVAAHSYVVKPGFEFGYATPKSSVILDYYLSANEYQGDYKINDDDYIGHDLLFSAQTQATDHLLLKIEDEYVKSRVGGVLVPLGNDINREKYQSNYVTPSVFFAVNDTWGVGAQYEYSVLDYAENANEGSDGHRGVFNLEYNLNSISKFNLEYSVWSRKFDLDTPTYVSNQLTLSYEKKYRLFSIIVGGGYHDRSFEDLSKDDFGTYVWDLILVGEKSKTDYSFRFYRNYNDFGEGQNYYEGIGVYGEVGHLFYEKFDLTVSADLSNRDYENSGRDDDRLAVTLSLDYLFSDRFSVGIESAYQERDSNIEDYDYENKYIMINAKFDFDFAPR